MSICEARSWLVTQQRRFVRGYAYRGLKLLFGEGLLTSEGELHRRQRRIAQPAFHRERIARYAESSHAKCRFDEKGTMDETDWRHSLDILARAGYAGPYTLVASDPTDIWGGIERQADFLRWRLVPSRGRDVRHLQSQAS